MRVRRTQISMIQCEIVPEYSFVDFLQGRLELNFTVAIDFTASNGKPHLASSLHHTSPYQQNQYQTALSAVGSIVQEYDTDKLFPAFGFGAKLPDGRVSFEFALVSGVGGGYGPSPFTVIRL